jgi:hypothetical protein
VAIPETRPDISPERMSPKIMGSCFRVIMSDA